MPQEPPPRTPGPPPRPRPTLDDLDRRILDALVADGRIPTAALARRLGTPESTCAGRVRALRERGLVTGIHAEVDPAAVGLPVQAMVAVRFGGHVRAHFEAFREEVPRIPGVLAAFHVSGADDYLVHVAAASSDALRDLVLDHLTSRPGVVHAETSLIFETSRGTRLSP